MKNELLTLITIAALLVPGALLAQPPNDNCWDVEAFPLAAGSTVVREGNNEGATDAANLGVAHVWEAFTITECLDVTVSYCGTTPAFNAAHRTLYVGCSENGFANYALHPDTGITACEDGNFIIPYYQLPAGTYYYLVQSQEGAMGDYSITFSGTSCTATPPANDDCAGAITLVPNSTCVTVTGDVWGANAGTSLPAITCAGWTGDASDDVWFQFEATDTEHTIMVSPSAQFDATVDLRSGECGSTVNIDCSEIGNTGGMEVLEATGLTIGETYYIRVYNWWSGLALTTTFDICILSSDGSDCEAAAGTLQGGGGETCITDMGADLIAAPTGDAVVPDGYTTVYVLTMGEELQIMDTAMTAQFNVDELGTFRIHTLVYHEDSLDLSTIEFGTTTGGDIHALLIQGGGTICASLDVSGAQYNVVECVDCDAIAGTFEEELGETCLVNGEASLIATPAGDAMIPDGYSTVFLLTSGEELLLQATSETPAFTVSAPGTYTMHTLVYDETTLDLSEFVAGETTGAEVYELLIEGGGSICASLDVEGATFEVVECEPCEAEAGTVTAVIGELCLVDGMATMEAIVNDDAVLPTEEFQQVFVLTQGASMVIVGVSLEPVFEVDQFGNYTIHSLVFDPATLNLSTIELGTTTAAEVHAMLQQGGGITCASLDLDGASFIVSDCTPSNDDCSTAQGLNIYETGNCVGNEVAGTTIFSTFGEVEPDCDPSDAGYADVWYVFNSGENTQVFIDVNSISMSSWGVAVYMDCGAGELVVCEAEPAAPLIVNTQEDTDYLVMIYTNLQSGQTGEFTICLTAEEAVNFCLGGTVTTNTGEEDLLICTNDPVGQITFISAGVAAQNYDYVLTDGDGVVIAILDGNSMDFTDAPLGTYQIHGISYNGMLDAFEEGDLITDLTSTGDCISLSATHVTITVDICTGIASSNTTDWSLYPNPTSGEINILYNGATDNVLIELVDMAGRKVAAERAQLNSGERHQLVIDEVLAPGMYTVVLTGREGRSTMRVIVQ